MAKQGKRAPAPPLYVVFSGDTPQFHVFNADTAARWVRESPDFTHFTKYVPDGRARRTR